MGRCEVVQAERSRSLYAISELQACVASTADDAAKRAVRSMMEAVIFNFVKLLGSETCGGITCGIRMDEQ